MSLASGHQNLTQGGITPPFTNDTARHAQLCTSGRWTYLPTSYQHICLTHRAFLLGHSYILTGPLTYCHTILLVHSHAPAPTWYYSYTVNLYIPPTRTLVRSYCYTRTFLLVHSYVPTRTLVRSYLYTRTFLLVHTYTTRTVLLVHSYVFTRSLVHFPLVRK